MFWQIFGIWKLGGLGAWFISSVAFRMFQTGPPHPVAAISHKETPNRCFQKRFITVCLTLGYWGKSQFLPWMDTKPDECQRHLRLRDTKCFGDRSVTKAQKLPVLSRSHSAESHRLHCANTNCVRGALSFVGPSTKNGMCEVSRGPRFCSGIHYRLAFQSRSNFVQQLVVRNWWRLLQRERVMDWLSLVSERNVGALLGHKCNWPITRWRRWWVSAQRSL